MSALPPEQELERITNGTCAQSTPEGFVTHRIFLVGVGDAQSTTERLREVLSALVQARDPWPEDEAWPNLLPPWFVAASPPPETREQAMERLQRRRQMTADERIEADRTHRWPVEDLVYWFEPDQRDWWIWGIGPTDDGEIEVCLASHEVAPAHAALDWLSRAAGAAWTESEDERSLDAESSADVPAEDA